MLQQVSSIVSYNRPIVPQSYTTLLCPSRAVFRETLSKVQCVILLSQLNVRLLQLHRTINLSLYYAKPRRCFTL